MKRRCRGISTVPDIEVFVGSKPRGISEQDEKEVVDAFVKKVSDKVPQWQTASEGRDIVPEPDAPGSKTIEMLHSEDRALTNGDGGFHDARGYKDGEACVKVASFPKGTHIATWGKYNKGDRESLKPPCSGSDLTVPCQTVLTTLKVSFSVP